MQISTNVLNLPRKTVEINNISRCFRRFFNVRAFYGSPNINCINFNEKVLFFKYFLISLSLSI